MASKKGGFVRLLIAALRDILPYNICIYAYATDGYNTSVTADCVCLLKAYCAHHPSRE